MEESVDGDDDGDDEKSESRTSGFLASLLLISLQYKVHRGFLPRV